MDPADAAPPLLPGHAHHDFRNAPPLLAALDAGFASIEADVWLEQGRLLVGHDREHLVAGRSMRDTYLDPLARRVRAGPLFAGHHPGVGLQLVVDVKTEATASWTALERILGDYADVVTHWRHGTRHERPVRVVVSGHRDLAAMTGSDLRWSGYDGRLADLDRDLSPEVMPMVSDDWRRHFTWRGWGPMPAPERALLADLVDRAHRRGRTLRFWGTPRTPPARRRVWQALLAAGVDYLNADDLVSLPRFLRRG